MFELINNREQYADGKKSAEHFKRAQECEIYFERNDNEKRSYHFKRVRDGESYFEYCVTPRETHPHNPKTMDENLYTADRAKAVQYAKEIDGQVFYMDANLSHKVYPIPIFTDGKYNSEYFLEISKIVLEDEARDILYNSKKCREAIKDIEESGWAAPGDGRDLIEESWLEIHVCDFRGFHLRYDDYIEIDANLK